MVVSYHLRSSSIRGQTADRSWEILYVAKTKISEVPVDRRAKNERRKESDRRKTSVPVAEEHRTGNRRKVQRRRQIDPTTCERDYTSEEIEFMQALDAYKRRSGRMFPTCSEILEVIRDMGYVRMESGNVVISTEPADATEELETVVSE